MISLKEQQNEKTQQNERKTTQENKKKHKETKQKQHQIQMGCCWMMKREQDTVVSSAMHASAPIPDSSYVVQFNQQRRCRKQDRQQDRQQDRNTCGHRGLYALESIGIGERQPQEDKLENKEEEIESSQPTLYAPNLNSPTHRPSMHHPEHSILFQTLHWSQSHMFYSCLKWLEKQLDSFLVVYFYPIQQAITILEDEQETKTEIIRLSGIRRFLQSNIHHVLYPFSFNVQDWNHELEQLDHVSLLCSSSKSVPCRWIVDEEVSQQLPSKQSSPVSSCSSTFTFSTEWSTTLQKPLDVHKQKPLDVHKQKLLDVHKEKPLDVHKQNPLDERKQSLEVVDGLDLDPKSISIVPLRIYRFPLWIPRLKYMLGTIFGVSNRSFNRTWTPEDRNLFYHASEYIIHMCSARSVQQWLYFHQFTSTSSPDVSPSFTSIPPDSGDDA